MEVEFELSLDDAGAWGLYRLSHSPQNKNQIFLQIIAYLLPILIVLAGIFFLSNGDRFTGLIVIGGGLALLIYFYVRFALFSNKIGTRRALIKEYGNVKNNVICQHKLIIARDGVTDITDMGQNTIEWAKIENIISTDKFIFVMLTGGKQAFIVPKRIFPDEAASQQFINEAETYRKKG